MAAQDAAVETNVEGEFAEEGEGLAGSMGSKQSGERIDISPLLGVVSALMMDSPAHQHFFLADMKWLVFPPVLQRQFRIYRNKGVPFAYVCWAFVNEETEVRLKAGEVRLRPDEWNNGDKRLADRLGRSFWWWRKSDAGSQEQCF